ncbi:MAG: MFS transporter [Ilumatobacteraceae bacterium]|nr:MFS transporter [Ilumatobacteraceae bacterium]
MSSDQTTSSPPKRHGSLGALRHRDFAFFWTAAAISNAGGWMQVVAVPALLYDMTNSSTWLGVSSMAGLLPAVFLTPYAGVLSDRMSRRKILMITQTVQMLCAFILWTLYLAGSISPGLIVSIALVGGIATGFQTAAWQSFVPLLVPPEELLDAVKLNSVQFTLARAIGPGFAGLVVSTLGTGAAIFINAITFLLVIAALALSRPRQIISAASQGKASDVIKAGGSFVWRHRPLRLVIFLAFITSLCGQSLQHIAPAIADRIYDRPSTDNAGLLVALGLGALTSSLFSVVLGDHMKRSTRVVVALILFTVSTAMIPMTSIYWVGLLAYFISGLAHLQSAVALNTLIQGTVPDHLRGRTMSFYVLGILAGIPLGAFILGRLGDTFTMRVAVLANAAVLFGVVVLLVARGWLNDLNTTKIEDVQESST